MCGEPLLILYMVQAASISACLIISGSGKRNFRTFRLSKGIALSPVEAFALPLLQKCMWIGDRVSKSSGALGESVQRMRLQFPGAKTLLVHTDSRKEGKSARVTYVEQHIEVTARAIHSVTS